MFLLAVVCDLDLVTLTFLTDGSHDDPNCKLYLKLNKYMTPTSTVCRCSDHTVYVKRKKSENVYFVIVESGLYICICEKPGLLNQSDTEVKDMGENLGKLLGQNFVSAKNVYIICFN